MSVEFIEFEEITIVDVAVVDAYSALNYSAHVAAYMASYFDDMPF